MYPATSKKLAAPADEKDSSLNFIEDEKAIIDSMPEELRVLWNIYTELKSGEKKEEVKENLRNMCRKIGELEHKCILYEKLDLAYSYSLILLFIYKNLFGENSFLYQSSFGPLGSIFHKRGKLEIALRCHDKAIKAAERAIAQAVPQQKAHYEEGLAIFINNKALVFWDLGKLDEAHAEHLKAYNIACRLFGDESLKIIPMLNNLAKLLPKLGQYEKAIKDFRKVLEIQIKSLTKNHTDVAHTLDNLGIVLRDTSNYSEALTCHRRSLAIHTKISDAPRGLLVWTYINIGVVYSKLGKFEDALHYYGLATDLQKTLDVNHPRHAEILVNIGNVYQEQGQYAQAISYYKDALKIQRKPGEADSLQALETLSNLANTYIQQEKFAIGKQLQETILKGQIAIYGENNPQIVSLYFANGNRFLVTGDYLQAFTCFKKGLEIVRNTFSEPHEKIAEGLVHLANYFTSIDQPQQALQTYFSALAMYEKISFGENPQVARAYNNIGSVLMELGQYDEAQVYLLKALRMDEKIFGKQSHCKLAALTNRGNVFVFQGNYPAALSCLQEAFQIAETAFGKSSSQAAKLHHDFAHLLADHRLFDQALIHYHESLKIFETTYGEKNHHVAMTHGSIGIIYAEQGDYERGIANQQKVIACFKGSIEMKSEEIATAYNNIASMYGAQKKYQQALENYQQAHAIHLNNLGPKHYKTCQIKVHLAKAYRDLGNSAEEKQAQQYYAAAASCYEELLTINRQVIQITAKTWDPYDLNGHHQVLSLLSNIYLRQGKISDAGILYFEETMVSGLTAILVFYYGTQAVKYLSSVTKQEQRLVQLYKLMADTAYNQQRYNLALKYLRKLIRLDNNNPEHQKFYQERYKATVKQRELMGVDIAVQLESCRDNYDEIRLQILEQLGKENLTDLLRNRCTELMISINNLLDISYSRFVRKSIHEPNRVTQSVDLYFPLANSQPALKRELERKQINIEPTTFKDEIFNSFKKPQDISLIKSLIKHGYLTQDRRVLKKGIEDPTLSDLDESFDGIREELADLLRKTGVKNLLQKSAIKDLNARIRTDIAYLPPSKASIVSLLENKQLVTVVQHSATAPKTCKLTQEIKWSKGVLVPETKDTKESKRFAGYEKQIMAKILRTVEKQKQLISLDKQFPQILELLQQQQPFHYYDEKQNARVEGFWKQSWLEKVIFISNSGKHISFAPHSVTNELTSRQGTLNKHQLKIMVCYVETGFYAWSFTPLIQAVQPMPEIDALHISAQIFKILKEKKYIQHDTVIHPLALQFLELAANPKDQKQREELEKKFLSELQKDLPINLQIYLNPLASLIKRRVLQFTHVELYFDRQVDLNSLVERSLMETTNLANAFAQTYHQPKKNLLLSKDLVETKAEVKQETLTLDHIEKKLAALLASTQLLEIKEVNHVYQDAQLLAAAYRKQGDVAKLGTLYLHVANKIADTLPSVAFHYYLRATHYLTISLNKEDLLYNACVDFAGFCSKQNLWQTGIVELNRHAQLLSQPKMILLHKKKAELEKQFKTKFKGFHSDTYSQFEHAKLQFFKFQYQLFKLNIYAKHPELIERLQSRVVTIVIKLRHLLDQAFTRVVHYQIYIPNKKWVSIHLKNAIKFYSCSSEKDFIDELRKKEIISEEKTKISLDRNFPEVFKCLQAVQSFTSDTWLKELILLSNQVKHVGFEVFQQGDITTYLQNIAKLLTTAFVESEKILTIIFESIPAVQEEKLFTNEPKKGKAYSISSYRFFTPEDLPTFKAVSIQPSTTTESKMQLRS